MKFKIDENLPLELTILLKEFGYDAKSVLDENLSGVTDEILINKCKEEKEH